MPSVVRGSDNFDSDIHQGIGVNQTWQDVTASRSAGVTYTNNTGKPIEVYVLATDGGTGFALQVSPDGINWVDVGRRTTSVPTTNSFIVPNTHSYRLENGTFSIWSELR